MSALFCALAAVWLTAAEHLFRDPCGAAALVPVVVAGLLAAGAAAWKPDQARFPALGQVVLGAGLGGALVMHFLFPPPELPFARFSGYRAFAAFGLVLAAAYLCLHLRASLRRARFLLLAASFLVMALAASPSWLWNAEALGLVAAALVLGQMGTVAAELAALLLLFAAPLGSPYGTAAAAVLVLWSGLLLLQRGARLASVAAPLAGVAYCGIALLAAPPVCEVPALGIGLFCAAAAVEGL